MIYDIILEFLKKNWKLYTWAIVGFLSIPLQKVWMPHYYGKIIEQLNGKKIDLAKITFLYIIGIWIMVQVLGILVSYINKLIWPKMHTYVRNRFMYLILDRYNESYEDVKTGDLQSKIQSLPYIIGGIIRDLQEFVFTNSLTIISTFTYLYFYHYQLALVYLISIICIIYLSCSYVKDCGPDIKKLEEIYDEYFEEVDDTFQNLMSVYTNKKIEDEKKRISVKNNKIENKQIKSNTCNLKYKGIYSLANIIVFICLNTFAYYLYANNKIPITVLVSVFIINYTLLSDLLNIFYDAQSYLEMIGKVKYVNSFIEKLPPERKVNNKEKIKNTKNINIQLKNIWFKHPGSDNYIYKNLNLNIPANQDIVIMGKIGSGKSTFAKMLVGLQHHQKGNIYLNDQNSKDININHIRKQIIYIPQHPQLFNRTLYENITYGLSESETKKIKERDITDLLRQLQFDDLANKFSDMMHQEVGKKGSKLSGGQRQIIWILRAYFRKSSIVFLDEPTSSLDPDSKRQVMDMIRLLKETKTVIVITHDTDLKQGMDRLIVFEDGAIIKDQILQ